MEDLNVFKHPHLLPEKKKRGKSIHFFSFFLCLFKDTYTDRVGYWDYCLICFRNQFKYSQTQQDLRSNTPAVEATGCWKNKRQAGRSEINSYTRKFQEVSIFLLLPPFFPLFPFWSWVSRHTGHTLPLQQSWLSVSPFDGSYCLFPPRGAEPWE